MKKWLKRIRGALGLGLTWAAAWSGVGVMFALLGFLGSLDPILDYVVVAFFFAIWGFVGGALSSVVLGITERRSTFDEMSLPRFAAWGAVGGLLLATLWLTLTGGVPPLREILGTGLLMTLMGAGSAGGSLALARRADPLLESGEDVGLLEGESPNPST